MGLVDFSATDRSLQCCLIFSRGSILFIPFIWWDFFESDDSNICELQHLIRISNGCVNVELKIAAAAAACWKKKLGYLL